MKIESKELINTLHTSINEIKNKTKSRSIHQLKQIKNDVETYVKEKINDLQEIKNDVETNVKEKINDIQKINNDIKAD